MQTDTIVILVVGFLALITYVRWTTLKTRIEKRKHNRRHDKRRAHTGRRVNEFNNNCGVKDKRKKEDRRTGSPDRRHWFRRHIK